MHLGTFQKKIRTLGIVIFLFFVLGATILLGKEASSRLARASTCQANSVKSTQVAANNAVIIWETTDTTQGRVEYGTNSTSLSLSVPELNSGKTHSVPLTLLTPNTVYYYLLVFGKPGVMPGSTEEVRCDSSGQVCTSNCVPWSFTTSTATPQSQIEKAIPTTALIPTKETTPTVSLHLSPSPEATTASGLSAFCQQVELNLGASSKDATSWATLKKYDVDGNGVINGLDVIKCQKSGK